MCGCIMPNSVQTLTLWSECAPQYEVNARCRLENQFPLSSFKWSIFFVSHCELHHGSFNSMGQLGIQSCLILSAGMFVCVVTSSLVRESGGDGWGSEWHTPSSLTRHPLVLTGPSPSLFLLHPSFFLPGVKDESNWCKTFKNEFGHVCHLQSGKERWLGPGHCHSTEIICYSALIGPDKTIP